MSAITISLAKPFMLHGKTVSSIGVKEPTGSLYATLGEPRLLVRNDSGSGYLVEQPATIRAYLEASIDHELGADVLSLLSLEDTMGVKDAVLSFFTAAAAALAEKRLSSSSSASTREPGGK